VNEILNDLISNTAVEVNTKDIMIYIISIFQPLACFYEILSKNSKFETSSVMQLVVGYEHIKVAVPLYALPDLVWDTAYPE
jgi:hypothetical protein